MPRTLVMLAALSLLAACAAQIEEAESGLYAPVFPTEELALSAQLPSGGIYSPSAKGLFATDRRAAQVGDILTVNFTERFAASKSQSAGSSKKDSFSVDVPNILSGVVNGDDLAGGTQRSFAGSGNAAQSNSLTGRLSVTVVRVFPGGNLEIMGQKKLTLNNGQEYVRLRGIVRPADISAQNVVLSDRIAAAEIKYVGAGDIADSARKGWLRRAMSAVAPM